MSLSCASWTFSLIRLRETIERRNDWSRLAQIQRGVILVEGANGMRVAAVIDRSRDLACMSVHHQR